MPEALLAAILADPTLKALLIEALKASFVEIAHVVVVDVLHRRATDPDYLSKSDALYQQWVNAQTDEEKLNAQKAMATLSTD